MAMFSSVRLTLLNVATLCALLPMGAAAQEQNPSFNLVNKSAKPVRELFVTPAGDANWGQNRLASGPVAPGASFAVRRKIDGNCIFDIRAVYADNTREEKRAINTCTTADVVVGGTAAASAKAVDDPTFRLTNHLKQPIVELEATPAGQPRGANLLAAGPLAPDGEQLLHPVRGKGCSFELRVVLADKSSKTRTLDLCKVTELSIP
jgi:hypothetical protein